jgi:hypothetical protein
MCFSKELSFLHFMILSFYGYYLQVNYNENDIWRLYIPLYYLGVKDLLQTFLYEFDDNEYYKKFFSILSYIHICFQPLFVNMLLSYFSKAALIYNSSYWNLIFVISFIFGLYQLTNLDVFDIQNYGLYCQDKSSDFCSDKNSSYIGKYHVAYKFRTKFKYSSFFLILMIIPGLFTNSYIHSIIWAIFILTIKIIFDDVRDGEKGAIWCLLSIIPTIPVVYYRKLILEVIEKIKL